MRSGNDAKNKERRLGKEQRPSSKKKESEQNGEG